MKNLIKLANDMIKYHKDKLCESEKIALTKYFTINHLTLKDRNFLLMRYGIEISKIGVWIDQEPLTYKEISKITKITTANLSYIRSRIFCEINRKIWQFNKVLNTSMPAICYNAIGKL